MQIHIITFMLLFLCGSLSGSEQVYYYGANDRKVGSADEALLKKEVRKITGSRYRLRILVPSDEGWQRIRTERIRIQDDSTQRIRYREGTLFPRSYERQIKNAGTDIYYFEEKRRGEIIRSGYTSSLLPVHLEGKVIEYYPGGNIKSESEYKDNMLVSNRNYNPDGTEYIHDVFYSTDQPALYSQGNENFQRFVNARMAKYGLPVHEIHDQVIIGAVVMESGELSGVRILEGNVALVNEFFRETIEMLPGKWEPAKLNGEPVRCLIRFPFNINKNASSLKYLQLSKDGQLFWHH